VCGRGRRRTQEEVAQIHEGLKVETERKGATYALRESVRARSRSRVIYRERCTARESARERARARASERAEQRESLFRTILYQGGSRASQGSKGDMLYCMLSMWGILEATPKSTRLPSTSIPRNPCGKKGGKIKKTSISSANPRYGVIHSFLATLLQRAHTRARAIELFLKKMPAIHQQSS